MKNPISIKCDQILRVGVSGSTDLVKFLVKLENAERNTEICSIGKFRGT